jgi:hypothetical protein
MRLVGQGLGWLFVKYPYETSHSLALASVGVACAYFVHGAIRQNSEQKRSRRQ